MAYDLRQKCGQHTGTLGWNGIPRGEIRIILTFFAIQCVSEYVISRTVEMFSVFLIGLFNGALVAAPIQLDDSIIGHSVGGVHKILLSF